MKLVTNRFLLKINIILFPLCPEFMLDVLYSIISPSAQCCHNPLFTFHLPFQSWLLLASITNPFIMWFSTTCYLVGLLQPSKAYSVSHPLDLPSGLSFLAIEDPYTIQFPELTSQSSLLKEHSSTPVLASYAGKTMFT